jgi:hypothetical protein
MEYPREILKKHLTSLDLQMQTLKAYHDRILVVGVKKAESLEESSLQEAYLKHFASVQDYLGSKIFPMIVQVAGLPGVKMSEVLENLEKEGVLGAVEKWAELRALRNDLDHDYPEKPELGLRTLSIVLEKFNQLYSIFQNVDRFSQKLL